MFRVQYLCPRESPYWQYLTGWFGLGIKEFGSLAEAAAQADGLIWRYHGARVMDPGGAVVYQV